MKKLLKLGVIEYSYFQIFLEWIHRANAAFIIGPLTIILFLYIILNKKLDKIFKTYSFYLIALLGIQGLFGGLTVMKSNIPWSVALHLASAFFLFFIVINIFLLLTRYKKTNFFNKRIRKKSNIYFYNYDTYNCLCRSIYI